MKKIIALAAMLCMAGITASAQEIFKEVVSLMENAEAIKNDTTKSMDARLVATFKADAIYYLIAKASDDPTFTELQLGQQTNAMIDFVNLYIKKLAVNRRATDRTAVKNRFTNATTLHPLFNDVDKEVIYAYIGNERYLTQFSLDTDWMKALKEVAKP